MGSTPVDPASCYSRCYVTCPPRVKFSQDGQVTTPGASSLVHRSHAAFFTKHCKEATQHCVITSSRPHIIASSRPTPRHRVLTSLSHRVIASRHCVASSHVIAPSRATSSRPHVLMQSRPHVITSLRLTSSRRHVLAASRLGGVVESPLCRWGILGWERAGSAVIRVSG